MKYFQNFFNKIFKKTRINHPVNDQDLNIYWDEEFAEVLETWGEGNVWSEIQFFLVGKKGRILDIACGTGKTIEILSPYKNLDIFGCDISDFLIEKAILRGIMKEKLDICDAAHMQYETDFFDYSYSIGSLEHLSDEGISQCIAESYRVTKNISFHTVPISRFEKDEGWITPYQSYFNNSTNWWMEKFKSVYKDVIVLDSNWNDAISKGKWFVCIKE